jgi:hypothetical protein
VSTIFVGITLVGLYTERSEGLLTEEEFTDVGIVLEDSLRFLSSIYGGT